MALASILAYWLYSGKEKATPVCATTNGLYGYTQRVSECQGKNYRTDYMCVYQNIKVVKILGEMKQYKNISFT